MGASLAGVPFEVNPSSVSWNYKIKSKSWPTIGGKVIQLYGHQMSDLTISGSFGGPDAVASQRRFFNFLKQIATDQAPAKGRKAGAPVRFLWSEQGWDFNIYILSMKQAGAGVSIETNERIHAPRYTIVGFVEQDSGDILRSVTGLTRAKFLERITDGLGWQQSDYNGPNSYDDVSRRLQGTSIYDFAFESYGLLEPSVTVTGATETSQQIPSTGLPPGTT